MSKQDFKEVTKEIGKINWTLAFLKTKVPHLPMKEIKECLEYLEDELTKKKFKMDVGIE